MVLCIGFSRVVEIMGFKQRIVKAMSTVMSLEGWFDIQGIDHNWLVSALEMAGACTSLL